MSVLPFLYLLKTSENQRFSEVFRRYRNGTFDLKSVVQPLGYL